MKTDGIPRMDWFRCIPIIAVHAMCLGVIWVGTSWIAVAVAVAFYFVRMFAITGWYHRYFSHRTFKKWTRTCQLAFAILGVGPLRPARPALVGRPSSSSPHRVRHQGRCAFAGSGWIPLVTYRMVYLADALCTSLKRHCHFAKYPELRFLDRFDILVPTITGFAMFGLGKLLETYAPGLGTSGPQMLIWGVLRFHRRADSRHLHHQLAFARLRFTAL